MITARDLEEKLSIKGFDEHCFNEILRGQKLRDLVSFTDRWPSVLRGARKRGGGGGAPAARGHWPVRIPAVRGLAPAPRCCGCLAPARGRCCLSQAARGRCCLAQVEQGRWQQTTTSRPPAAAARRPPSAERLSRPRAQRSAVRLPCGRRRVAAARLRALAARGRCGLAWRGGRCPWAWPGNGGED